MEFISLQSGSNGNCFYLEAGGVRILFDAGISGVRAEQRLAAHGRDIREVDALIISHDHTDHIAHAGVYQRKYGIPLYITPRTLEAGKNRGKLGKIKDINHFESGDTIDLGHVQVETLATKHDSADGSCFVVTDGSKRLGVMTDLGHVFPSLASALPSLDAVFIESNYDPDLLTRGPYPQFLKQRIRGEGGHISNIETAGLVASLGDSLRWVCLGHLSEANNTPALALEASHRALGGRIPIHVAPRYDATDVMKV